MSGVLYTLPLVDVLLDASDSHKEFGSAVAEFKKLAIEQGAKFMEEVMLPKSMEGSEIRKEVRDAKRRAYYDWSFAVQLLRIAVYELEDEIQSAIEEEILLDELKEDPDDSGS